MSIFRLLYKLPKIKNLSQNTTRNLRRIVTPQDVSNLRTVPNNIKKPTYVYDYKKYEMEIQARYKGSMTRQEMRKFREACVLARRILEEVGSMVKSGVTTDYLDEIAHKLCIANHCYPAPLLYKGFPKSICTSINNVACHGIPDDRELCGGDVINIDVTVFKDGFYGDTSHTYIVPTDSKDDGNNSDILNSNNNDNNINNNANNINNNANIERLVATAELCRDEAIKCCMPGRKLSYIGHVISEIARDRGLIVIPDICGHGISSFFHGPPCIYHADNNMGGSMREGMSFTIEPVICEGSGELEILSDGWTVVTLDGGCSAQFEHTIVISRTGSEVLTLC